MSMRRVLTFMRTVYPISHGGRWRSRTPTRYGYPRVQTWLQTIPRHLPKYPRQDSNLHPMD